MEHQTTPFQRIISLILVILLLLMVIGTLVVAIFASDSHLFPALLLADIALPIIGFIWIQTYKWYQKGKAEIGQTGLEILEDEQQDS